MNTSNTYKLFNASGCLSREAIFAYVRNNVDEKSLLIISEHIKVCDLCNDAIEGFKSISDRKSSDLSIKSIDQFIDQKTILIDNKIAHPFASYKIKRISQWAVASAIVVLGVVGYQKFKDREMNRSHSLQPRLLGENVQPLNNDFFSILSDVTLKNISSEPDFKPQAFSEGVETITEAVVNENNLKKENVHQAGENHFVNKDDMIIRESKVPELLTPINYPFEVFVQKKLDSLLEPSQLKYSITAEFVISKEGKMKQPKVVESSNTKLDAFTMKVLEESFDWKPATINNTPVDYPVKLKIRKD